VIQRPASRVRLGLASAAVIALLVLSTGSVAADTTPGGDGTFTQNGTTAEAFGGDCTANGNDTTTCSELRLSVFVGKMSDSFSGVSHANQVCAYVASYTFDDTTGDYVGDPVFESGCQVDLPKAALRIGKNLSSVTLASTTVSIEEYICDEFTCEPGASRDITVVGTWTGVGPISFSKSRSTYDDGTCRSSDSGKGSSREATFVGTIDGQTITGEESYAAISNGKFSYRSRCIEV
jgi:hypothetical protein